MKTVLFGIVPGIACVASAGTPYFSDSQVTGAKFKARYHRRVAVIYDEPSIKISHAIAIRDGVQPASGIRKDSETWQGRFAIHSQ